MTQTIIVFAVSFLCIFSWVDCLYGMNQQIANPSLDHAQVTALFQRACKNYGIPQDQIKLELSLHKDKIISGEAFPEEKKVTFVYGKNVSIDSVIFGLHHEIAHCLDKELIEFHKKKFVRMAGLFGGVFTSTVALTAAGFEAINYAIGKCPSQQDNPLIIVAAAGTFLGSCAVSGYLAFLYSRSQGYRFEHRANIQACKTLLESNSFDPIVDFMVDLKYAASKNSRLHFLHPPAIDEFRQLKKYLEDQGYQVQEMENKKEKWFNITLFKGEQLLVGCTLKY